MVAVRDEMVRRTTRGTRVSRHFRPSCVEWWSTRRTIEALNRQLRKAIKTKGHLPNEEAARKLIYLAIVNAVPAWTRTRNRTTALRAFTIRFGERLPG